MKKFRGAAIRAVIYALSAALLGAGGWWGYKVYKKTSQVEAEIEKVSVSRGDIDVKFQDLGDLSPKDIVEVFAKVGGTLEEVAVREGEAVRKGQRVAMVQPGQSSADKYLPVEVVAPMDGIVMACESRNYYDSAGMAKTGQRISGVYDSGSPTCLMQVGDIRKMVIKLNVSEMEVLKLRKGMPVKITADALPGVELSGTIDLIAPSAEKDNRSGVKTFRVEAGVPRPTAAMRPGMTARIETVMDSKKNALKMPISGLFEEHGRRFAYLYVAGAAAKKVPLTIGLRNEMDVEIIKGLNEGDEVYSDKPLNVQEEAPAKPAAAVAAAAPAKKGS
jgi:multidrug efflux pump subunit AcrA (membrane-fusion protein)